MSVRFLLTAQALLDLCDSQPNKARTWSHGVQSENMRVSVISWAQAFSAIDLIPKLHQRRALNQRMQAMLSNMAVKGRCLIPFEENDAKAWQGLILDEQLSPERTQTDRQIYAIALNHNLTVVEPPCPRLQHYLASLGLRIVTI